MRVILRKLQPGLTLVLYCTYFLVQFDWIYLHSLGPIKTIYSQMLYFHKFSSGVHSRINVQYFRIHFEKWAFWTSSQERKACPRNLKARLYFEGFIRVSNFAAFFLLQQIILKSNYRGTVCLEINTDDRVEVWFRSMDQAHWAFK